MDLVSIVVAVGVPVLALLFYLEGMLIGKALQPPWIFVGYVTVAEPSWGYSLFVVAICAGSATVGQWTLYHGFDREGSVLVGLRRWIPYADSIPGAVHGRIPDRTMTIVQRQFDHHGGLAICGTNALPILRGLLTIPAGVAGYPRRRFLVASAVGNVLYVLLYLGVAWGLVEVVQAVFGG